MRANQAMDLTPFASAQVADHLIVGGKCVFSEMLNLRIKEVVANILNLVLEADLFKLDFESTRTRFRIS